MSPKRFDYGVLTQNVLALESPQTRTHQRTVLVGTIVKIENATSTEVLSVKFLEEDGETWESTKFLCERSAVAPVSKELWPFLASVNSPQERVKLAKNRTRSLELMKIPVDATVGFLNFDDIVLATVKFIGRIQGLGKGFGLLLHEKNPKSTCDGTCGGVRYFKCNPGFAVFTTIECVIPYSFSTPPSTLEPISKHIASSDLSHVSDKDIQAISISNGNNCDANTFIHKNNVNQRNSSLAMHLQGKDASTKVSTGNVKPLAASVLDIFQKTSNENNDFDHNTIIQRDDLHLMHNSDLKGYNVDPKKEIDLADVIGNSWLSNNKIKDFEQNRTLRKAGEKPHKSVFYTACPESAYTNEVINPTKSKDLINQLSNTKTVPRRTKNSFSAHNLPISHDDEIYLDRKAGGLHIQINQSTAEEKAATKTAVQYNIPKPGTTNDLTIGSLVEILNDVSEQPLYGVVRWLGVETTTEQVLVGVELEEEHSHLPLILTDGTHNGQRYFKCNKNKGIFVPLSQCHKDSRFMDGTNLVALSTPEQTFGEEMDCPIIKGAVAPLCMPTEEDVEAVCGKFRGIQGHHNSCYLDATLFAMFTFTSVFDTLLYRPKGEDDIVCYEEVQQVLREQIVNPLRANLFVRADRIMNLRKWLDRLSSVSGLTTEEKDPEEFLHSLLAQILKADPYLKLSSGQEAYHYQLFLDKEDHLTLPSVQHLFEQSFLASNIKLKEVPSCLIIQMPRFGKNYKMYPRILPSQLLDVTDVIENSPRQCTVCGNLAMWECTQCFGQCGVGLESTAFCTPCLEKAHTHNKRATHSPKRLSVSADFSIMADHCTPPRLFMELFAVICIETSHYVAFVKCGVGHEAPWCFFDSMADRQGGQNGYNIPEMVACPDVSKWLSDELSCRQLHENAPTDKYLPEYARRLLCDAYICMYQSPDVMMYN